MSRKGENIYKRADGRWEGRYKYGFDKNGKAKYKSVYAKTYKDCKEKMNNEKNVRDTENKYKKINSRYLYGNYRQSYYSCYGENVRQYGKYRIFK